MDHQIPSEKAYQKTMFLIYDLMNKGEANLSNSEIERLRELTLAAEKFEDKTLD